MQKSYNVPAGPSVLLHNLVAKVKAITRHPVACSLFTAASWDVRSGCYSYQAPSVTTEWQTTVDLSAELPVLVRVPEKMPT